MAQESSKAKWEGKATEELQGSKAEQIWPLVADFCNIDKFFPNMDICDRVEGSPGQPGLVRYCVSQDKWANEKLLTIDPTNLCMSYAVLENNLGFNNYVATLKVLPLPTLQGDEKNEYDGRPCADAAAGCKIEWSFVVDPFDDGWKFEDLLSFIDYCLQFMAKKMEDAIKTQNLQGEI
ncbi:Polyketide cyclase/dehydrase [Corchorus capsularis]|uniref:Polyketide cyclase/dehydrase n=1 Tax=Corchorus capsularis TaxID=210143 RepID=A0A1R3JMX1_COCAP|nr:Polyketide cyclase/dehydrase [Corchorus capsularis]